MVLGGAFGRCLGHEGGALMKGIIALMKETPPPTHTPRAPSPLPPYEDTVRRQEEGPHQNVTVLAP